MREYALENLIFEATINDTVSREIHQRMKGRTRVLMPMRKLELEWQVSLWAMPRTCPDSQDVG
jgi:hypothetical protein